MWYENEPPTPPWNASANGPHMQAQCTELAAPKTKLSNNRGIAEP
jgi:hypothetical protein